MRRAALAGLLAALAALPAWAHPRRPGPPPSRIEVVIEDIDRLAREAETAHPLDARALEARIRDYGLLVKTMGPEALGPLGAALRDRDRPLRLRLYAAAFLGLHGDPGALKPLSEEAFDGADDAGVRSAALQAVGSLRLEPALRRRVFDKALGLGDAPAPVWREALAQLADLGTEEPDRVVLALSRGGARPEDGRRAARAIARSPLEGAWLRLLDLLPRVGAFPEAEQEALGLLAQKERVFARLAQAQAVFAVLRRGRGRSAVLAARASARLAVPEAADELRRALKARDPEVVAQAAEALADLRDPKGSVELQRLARGLPADGRFAGGTGADTAALAARVEAAAGLSRGPAGAAPEAREPPVVTASPEAKSPKPAPRLPEEGPPPEARSGRPVAFRFDGVPGEGRPAVSWRGGAADLFERPDPTSRHSRVELPAGGLEWGESAVVTVAEGEAAARRDLQLDVEDLGPFTGRYGGAPGTRSRIEVRAGEPLYILAVRAGGSCFVRRARRLIEMECPQYYPGPYEVRRLPATEWWVRLGAPGGGGWLPVGWRPQAAP